MSAAGLRVDSIGRRLQRRSLLLLVSMLALCCQPLRLASATGPANAGGRNVTQQGEDLRASLEAMGATLPEPLQGPLDESCTSWRPVVLCGADPTGGIESITLNEVQAAGPLPEDWATLLPNLKDLVLANNKLNGTLPLAWSALSELSLLDVSNNTLTGDLPATWSNLKMLAQLKLSNNNLTGTLPAEWSEMQSLTSLSLEDNRLTGTIPQAWADAASFGAKPLQRLQLTNNTGMCAPDPWKQSQEATASQPSSFEANGTQIIVECPLSSWAKILLDAKTEYWPFVDWTDRGYTRMVNNTCACTANFECGNEDLKIPTWSGVGCNTDYDIVRLDMSMSGIDVNVPETISSLTTLTQISFNEDGIQGTLPVFFSALTELRSLSFESDATIGGTLPEAWSTLVLLSKLLLNGNHISGTVPPQWSAMTSLMWLALDTNWITGVLPANLPSTLTELSIFDNRIQGGLPKEWSSLVNLNSLALQLNQLTGTIPAEWSTMQSLADVRFGNNSLSGQIPPVLGESWTGPASSTEKLQVQLMNNPGLCGSLPAEWMPKDPADSGSSLNGTGYLAYAVIKNTGIEAGEACASSESPVLASPPALLPVPQSAPPRPPTYDAEEEGLSGGGVAAAILGTLLAVAVILVGIVICMQVRRTHKGLSYSFRGHRYQVGGGSDQEESLSKGFSSSTGDVELHARRV